MQTSTLPIRPRQSDTRRTEIAITEVHVYGRMSCGSQRSRSPQSRPLARRQPREAELVDTAEILERDYDREDRIVALDIPDREAIRRVLEEYPEELLELRATLLKEHIWRQRERF